MASSQALILGSILFFSMAVGYTSGAWCICKPGSDAALQKILDYACGHGADCNPIKSTGACYNPNSMQAHCSYAANSYYQRMSSTGATCDFSGAAYLSNSDPSVSGCSYPASASTSGTASPTTGTTPVGGSGTTPIGGTTPTGTTPVSGTTPSTTTSPYSSTGGATPSTGVLGGVGTGLAPTGMGMDDNKAGIVKLDFTTTALFSVMAVLMMVNLWN